VIRGGFPKKMSLASRNERSCGEVLGIAQWNSPCIECQSEALGSITSTKSQNKTALKRDGSFEMEGTPGHRMASAKVMRQEFI
jgi:hypothetical protein